MHKQVCVQLTSNSKIFVQILQKGALRNFRPNPCPRNEKLQISDDQSLLQNAPPPIWKTSDLRWPKFTPKYPPIGLESGRSYMETNLYPPWIPLVVNSIPSPQTVTILNWCICHVLGEVVMNYFQPIEGSDWLIPCFWMSVLFKTNKRENYLL